MKRCGAGRRLVAWMLVMMLAVQGGMVLPQVHAEETDTQPDDVVSVRVVDKDVLMAVTQNSPYSVKELSEVLDLGTVLTGQSFNVSTTNIDATDLSNWYVYDHYDTAAYVSGNTSGTNVKDEAQKVWEQENGYNQKLRPFYGYSESAALVVSDDGYSMEEIENNDTTKGNVYHLKEHIVARSEDGSAAMKFYGYGSSPYTDFLFYPANQIGTKNVEYTIDAKDVKTHSLANAGFLFNCGITDGKLTGYAMMFEYDSGTESGVANATDVAVGIEAVHLYKLDNVSVEALHNNGTRTVFPGIQSASDAGITGVSRISSNELTDLKGDGEEKDSYFKGHFDVSNIVLEITADSFKATMTEAGEDKAEEPETVTLFDIQSLNNTEDNYEAGFVSTNHGGFGPIIAYQSHSCEYTSTYKYSNLKMSITESESVLCGLSNADFVKNKQVAGEYEENDKYFILIGDNEEGDEGYKDFFKRDFDDVYLEMLKNQHVILVTNLNIEKLAGEINGTDYNLEDYLGAGNVIQLTGDTPEELAEEIRQIVESSQYDIEAADNAKNALDSETGTGHEEKAAATLAVRYQGYQVDTVNVSRLPSEGITLTLDTEGSIGVDESIPTYSLRKPDGTVEQLEGAEITILPSDALQSGEYVVTVVFDKGVEASSRFNVSAYHNSYFNNVCDAEGIDSDGLHFVSGTVGTNKVVDGQDYTVVLCPDAGYELPKQLYVMADEEIFGTEVDADGEIRNKDWDLVALTTLVEGEDYTYDSDTGEVWVDKEAITGNLYFYADTSKVTYQLTNVKVFGEARTVCSMYDEEDFSVTLTASGDAELPETIYVSIGEETVTLSDGSTVEVSGEDVSYQDGTLTIAKALLKDDIIIRAVAGQYDVIYELKNIESSNKQTIVTSDADYETVLTPDADYELPEDVIVAIDGRDTDQYSYNKTTGALTIYKEAITGDVLIVAEGKKKAAVEPAKEYNVTYHLTNLTTTGANKANSKTDYVTTLAPVGNYRLPADFIITVAGQTLKAGEGYGYNGLTGTITIPAAEITGDIVITAAGVVFEQTTQPKPDTDKLTVIPPKYEDSKDGKIIGVTLDMEYSVDNGKTWTKCTSNTINNLGVGTVKIRFYGTDLKKSSPIANIEIESSTSEYYIPTIYMTKKMGLNQKFQLKLVNTKGAAIKYSSSNTKIVTVNKKGVITSRKKTGKAKVVITLIKGKHIVQYVAKVTVDKKVKKNYSLAKFKTTYKSPTIAFYKNVGKDKSWKIKLTHTNNATLTFKSSDESVAIVDKKGKVTGVSPGKATVTIKVNNQGVIDKYYAVIRVTDENVPTDVSYLKVLK